CGCESKPGQFALHCSITRAIIRGRESRVQFDSAILRANFDENHLLPSQLLRRMRERAEAAFQPRAALFLRRVRGAYGPPGLFQTARRAAALRDPGGLRVEQNAHAWSERATERRRFHSGGVGARYCDGAEP